MDGLTVIARSAEAVVPRGVEAERAGGAALLDGTARVAASAR